MPGPPGLQSQESSGYGGVHRAQAWMLWHCSLVVLSLLTLSSGHLAKSPCVHPIGDSLEHIPAATCYTESTAAPVNTRCCLQKSQP